ncbi:amine oxidase catalytic domain-containing protein [Ascobolus immersus RN42]|uniref:Amine oxidase n=1 Tax=Ascobolus immersus RN42 TaxID=1160509 RepID=A0A3N4HKU7_ASCIM|nr:amine oxidase catalytic domain-containing protein [Ascobolus immersus RN42]
MKLLSLLLLAASAVDVAESTALPGGLYNRLSGLDRRQFHSLRRSAQSQDDAQPITKPPGAKPEPGCSAPSFRPVKAPYENIFSGLTTQETVDLTSFLIKDSGLNLTLSENATAWDNTIITLELLTPNKTDALAHTDGTSAPPTRYAHVVIDFRAREDAYIQNFMVGPLPVKKGSTKAVPLDFPYNGKNGGKIRNYQVDAGLKYEFLVNVTTAIDDITLDLFNISLKFSEKDNGALLPIDPIWREGGRTISWDHLWSLGSGENDIMTIQPSGLHFKTDMTGRDPSKWKLMGLWFNKKLYKSVAEFRKAYEAGKLPKDLRVEEGEWSSTDPSEEDEEDEVDGNDIEPPSQIAPSGGRHRIDVEQNYVEWMGFSFFIGFKRDTGLRLWDIKWKGERIIYELGLEEALATYAGSAPTHSGAAFLDSFFAFGPFSLELLPGYDCPAHATFLNTSHYSFEQTVVHPNALCIFEQDAGMPIYRHTSSINPSHRYASATKNTYLVVRTIATMGNYDYMFDYKFYLDGSMSIEVHASGLIMSAHAPGNDDYGFEITDNLSGSVHDHILNYKLDFDILGTANSVRTTEFVPANVKYDWADKPRSTMKIKRGWLKTENESQLNWHPNSAQSYTIVNKDKKNALGEHRGYRFIPRGVIHSTILDSPNLKKAAEWRHHHFYITKRKETERSSANPRNGLDTDNVMQDFSKFFNGESLDQEDVVVWFNLGMHHMPTSQDLPNTVMTTAHSAMFLEPINFNKWNPAKQSRKKVRVEYEAGKVNAVEFFGMKEPACRAVDGVVGKEAFGEYKGDVANQKFAYDPRNWYYKTHYILEG